MAMPDGSIPVPLLRLTNWPDQSFPDLRTEEEDTLGTDRQIYRISPCGENVEIFRLAQHDRFELGSCACEKSP